MFYIVIGKKSGFKKKIKKGKKVEFYYLLMLWFKIRVLEER